MNKKSKESSKTFIYGANLMRSRPASQANVIINLTYLNSARNDDREITGLWSNAYSRSSGCSHFYQPESNPSRSGQHDIHLRDRSRGVSAEETSLSLRQPQLPSAQRCHNGCDSSMSSSEVATSRQLNASRSKRAISRLLPCPCLAGNDSDSENEEHSERVWSTSRVPSTDRIREIPIPENVHRIIEYTHFLIPSVDKIYSASYYWGRMDRFKAETILDGKPEGSFLLRDSAQSEYLFSVSFRRFQRTLHARIEQGRNMFSFDILDESVFSANNVTDLIANYKDPAKCLFFEPQLSNPIPRNFAFSLQELCRAKIASTTSYAEISNLHLPSQLKSFVRELHYSVPVRTLLTSHE